MCLTFSGLEALHIYTRLLSLLVSIYLLGKIFVKIVQFYASNRTTLSEKFTGMSLIYNVTLKISYMHNNMKLNQRGTLYIYCSYGMYDEHQHS